MAENKENKKDKIIKRQEEIIFTLAEYITELTKGYDENNFEHHNRVFGITKKEYKKYFEIFSK